MRNRIDRHDIKALQLLPSGVWIMLGENQTFCETPKSYEIWDNSAVKTNLDCSSLVKRISKKTVGFVSQQ